MNDIAFVTWTNTECEDVFPLYFGQFDKYCNDYKSYVIINENSSEIPERHQQLVNAEDDPFYKRFIGCLEQIEEKYVIYMQEDHILYDELQKDKLSELFEYMKDSDYSCLRLIKSGEMGGEQVAENIFEIPATSGFLLSQQTAIWLKEDLIKLFNYFKPITFRDVEQYGSFAFSSSRLKCCYYYNNEEKRGNLHFDSSVVPYVATAINKRKWNLSEYRNELLPLLEKYGIDYTQRGEC